MAKLRSLLMLFLLVLIVPIVFSAVWQIHSSWSLNSKNANPFGITSNATTTVAGDVWVVDDDSKLIFHYRPDGTYVENFSTTNVSTGYPTAVWVNKSVENQTFLYFITTHGDWIHIINSTGENITQIDISEIGFTSITGLTSDGDLGDNNSYWVLDPVGKKIYELNYTGTIEGSCSVASYADTFPIGLTTNSSEKPITYFWLTDWYNNEIYRIDTNCMLQETINLPALGITRPKGIETYYRNAAVNDLLVVSSASDKVYRLTYTDSAPTAAGQGQQHDYLNFTNSTWLNVTCSDDIDVASAYLAVNITGVMVNYTNGEYNSPVLFPGTGNTTAMAIFNWTNLLFNAGGTTKVVGWQVQCIDSADQSVTTGAMNFSAGALKASCYRSNLNISNVTSTITDNVTAYFTGNGTTNCSFRMQIKGTTGNYSCPYSATLSDRMWNRNITDTSCNVTATYRGLSTNRISVISIATPLRAAFPPNLPVAIVSMALVYIIYIIVRVRRSRRSTS